MGGNAGLWREKAALEKLLGHDVNEAIVISAEMRVGSEKLGEAPCSLNIWVSLNTVWL